MARGRKKKNVIRKAAVSDIINDNDDDVEVHVVVQARSANMPKGAGKKKKVPRKPYVPDNDNDDDVDDYVGVQSSSSNIAKAGKKKNVSSNEDVDAKARSSNFVAEEIEVLVTEMEQHRHILIGKFSNKISKQKKKSIWQAITDKINAAGKNEKRSVQQVKNKWKDISSRSKKKSAERKADTQRRTGGGKAKTKELTDIETRVVALLGKFLHFDYF